MFVVALMGRPAAGKSTLAGPLVCGLGGVLVSTARIKEDLRPDFVTADCFDEELREAAYLEAFRRCRKALRAGLVPVVDAGFFARARRRRLYEVVQPVSQGVVLVYCRCDDLAEVERRIRGREVGPRSADSHANSVDLHRYLHARFEEPAPAEVPPNLGVVLVRADSSRGVCGELEQLGESVEGLVDFAGHVRDCAVSALERFADARLSGFDASLEAVDSSMCSRGPEVDGVGARRLAS